MISQLFIAALDIIVELPDILFISIAEDQNWIFDGVHHHYQTMPYSIIWFPK